MTRSPLACLTRCELHCRPRTNRKLPAKSRPPDNEGESILELAMQELALSARAHHKIIRVSRTIADLDGAENISAQHLSEAVQYRNLDREMWF